jgi:polyisoprenoid-binding protein YceI
MKTLLLMLLMIASGTAAAAEFRFDAANSELRFGGDYGGEPVPGKFARFSGTATLDPANLSAMRLRTEIEVASLDTEYADRDEVLRSSDWFDTDAHPRALWASSSDCRSVPSGLECPGDLTLRGSTRPVPLLIALDGASTLSGTATLDRRAFGVGKGEWDADGTIADAVKVSFRLSLLPR